MPENTEVRRPQMGLTFEDIWALFQESDRKFQAMLQETEKQFQETDKKIQKVSEQMEKTDRKIARLSKNIGGNNRSIGELVETLIAARLWKKFAAYPYHLEMAYQRLPIYDEHKQLKSDIDILLVDTEWCMAVEVKREANKDDVERHLKRMELIRKYPPAQVVGKKMLGALAGGIVSPDARDFAHECGFFVLELKGESVALLNPPEGFTPGEW
jgi:predicted AAA+ superfamily ATPase